MNKANGKGFEETFTDPLQAAYSNLMDRAPGAAFKRARTLYLNKYNLPQPHYKWEFRMFVSKDLLNEKIKSIIKVSQKNYLAKLTSCPEEFAIVHWNKQSPPKRDQLQEYLYEYWKLDINKIKYSNKDIQWFRNAGYQIRFPAPQGIIWEKEVKVNLQDVL